MSGAVHASPVGVPSNPAAVATPSPAAAPAGTPAAAVVPVAAPAAAPSAAPAPAAAPPAVVEPAGQPAAPAAGEAAKGPDGNLLGDALAGEPKPAEDPAVKPAEDPAAKPAEPLKAEDYKFEVPKGLDETNPLFAPFRDAAAKSGLTNEAAQALLTEVGPKIAEQLAAPHKAWEALQAEWQNAVKTDPEIGGAKLTETVARVTGLLRQFGHPDLPNALAISGMGNNPALISTLNKLALRVMESSRPEIGGAPPNPGGAPGGTGARSLYSSTVDGEAPKGA